MAIVNKNEIIKFYNSFHKKLEHDKNIQHARYRYIEDIAKKNFSVDNSVLDLGCGIGTTSSIISKYVEEVLAIDIAPNLINYARKYHNHLNISYMIEDIEHLSLSRKFDAVCLFDVLEHIHHDNIINILRCIRHHLNDSGDCHIVIPYWRYLDYKKKNQPQTIQIIDNSITLKQLEELVSLSGLEITKWEVLSLYNYNDYTYIKLNHAKQYKKRKDY